MRAQAWTANHVSREYNEDPVLKTFLPSSWFSARRRTILMILIRAGRR